VPASERSVVVANGLTEDCHLQGIDFITDEYLSLK